MKINIKIGKLTMEAELNDTPTAKKVAEALPIKTSFSTWGDEIYFSIPVTASVDKTAKEVVEVGDECEAGVRQSHFLARPVTSDFSPPTPY